MDTTFDFGDGPVSARRHVNPDGSQGGWVADTATVAPTAYVGPHARVFGQAKVCDEAMVYDRARVSGHATVSGKSRVFGQAKVYEDTLVCGEAKVFDCAVVCDQATVSGRAIVSGDMRVGRDRWLSGLDLSDADVPESGPRQEEKAAEEGTIEACVEVSRMALRKFGRMAIEYAVADQICRHALGQGIDDLMPAGGYGTFAALWVTDIGLTKAFRAMFGKKGGRTDRKLLTNEATAELKGGVWLVTGVEDGMVTAMDPEEFRRFEAKIAKDGAILTKVVPGDDGTVTTMTYGSGKLHKVGAPAVVRTKNGEVVDEIWFEGGRQVVPPAPAAAMKGP